MLRDDLGTCATQDVTKHKGCNDRVVERSEERDKLRYEIDRRSDPQRGKAQEHLGAARYARIADEPTEQTQQVREQLRQLARGRSPTHQDQNDDEDKPQPHGGGQSDQERTHSDDTPGDVGRHVLVTSLRAPVNLPDR